MKYDFTEEMQTFQRNQDLDIDSPSRFTYKKELAAIDSDVGDDPNVLSSNFAPINEKSGSTSGVNANDSKQEPPAIHQHAIPLICLKQLGRRST